MWLYTVASCSITIVVLLLILFVICWIITPKPEILPSLKGLHVLITGGSRGIGFAAAVEAASQGAKVTVIARGEEGLRKVTEQLRNRFLEDDEKENIQWIAADLTSSNFDDFAQIVQKAEEKLGPIDVLVNNAGGSIAADFESLPISAFPTQMSLNFFSAVYMTRAVISGMKERKRGRIVLLCSVAGQVGLFGYSAYSASKFALRGFAESLQMELLPYNIWLTVVYPPDTETEGYAIEIQTMPKETRLISEAGGLFKPAHVAEKMLKAAREGRLACSYGLDGWMVSRISCGMSYVTSPFEAMEQVCLMGLLRLVSMFYLFDFARIVRKCKGEDKKQS